MWAWDDPLGVAGAATPCPPARHPPMPSPQSSSSCLFLFLSPISHLSQCHFYLPFLLFFHFPLLWCGGRLIMARGPDKLSPQTCGDWATCVPPCEPIDITHTHKSFRKHYDFSRLHVVDFSCVGVSVIKPYIGIDFYVFIMNTSYALS